MSIQTFLLSNAKESLIHKEILDESGKTIYLCDWEENQPVETYFEYNTKGQVVVETEKEGDIELKREENEYDEKGRLVRTALYVDNELVQFSVSEHGENGYVNKTIRYDEEAERIEHKELDGKSVSNYFLMGVLQEVHETSRSGNRKTIQVFDAQKRLQKKIVSELNNKGQERIYQEFNPDGSLLGEIKREWNNHLLMSETQNFDFPTRTTFEYDENGNCLRSETRDFQDNLISFSISEYDSQGRILSEKTVDARNSFSNSDFGSSNSEIVFRYQQIGENF